VSSTLFGSTTPGVLNGTDAVTYALGTQFSPGVDGTITHGKWYFPTLMSGVTVAVYRVTGVVTLGTKAFPDNTPAGWQTVAFDTPIAVTAGTAYRVAIWTPSHYTATGGFSWPFTSGDLTAAATNGYFTSGIPSNAMPTTASGSSAAYFADVVFEPDAAPSTVTSDLDVRWGIRSAVTSDADLRWGIRSAVTSDVDLRWGVRAAVTSDLDLVWGLGGVVTSDLDVRWRVLDDTPDQVVRAGGWESFGNALRFNAEEARREAETPPVDCPNDGEPLQLVRGVWWCRADGWQWPAKRIVSPTA
jgi:hypothetical protein